MASTLTFAPMLPAPSGHWLRSGEPAAPPRLVVVDDALDVAPPPAGVCARPARAAGVYRRRRVLTGLALVVLGAVLGTAATAVGVLGSPAAAGSAQVDTVGTPLVRTHVVAAGETLWSIAAGMGGDGDIRGVVDRLAARNGGSALQVGQVLELVE